jgi:hypothetical protein
MVGKKKYFYKDRSLRGGVCSYSWIRRVFGFVGLIRVSRKDEDVILNKFIIIMCGCFG